MSAAIQISKARHRGDPGLLSAIGGVVGSLIPGVGTVAGAGLGTLAEGLIGGGRRTSSPRVPRPPTFVPQDTTIIERDLPFLGGAFGGRETRRVITPRFAPQTNGGGVGTQLACPSGFRPNKTSYFLRNGTFVPKGTRCVKIRRRNAANPRALDRAIGRLNSAKRLQHKLAGFSTRKYTKSGKRAKASC